VGADQGQRTGPFQTADLIESQSSTPQQVLREAVITKVKKPHVYTLLSTPEAATFFQVKPRTICRWTLNGDLRSGARRGSITIDSVLRLEKKDRGNARTLVFSLLNSFCDIRGHSLPSVLLLVES
jgi:hypothetical protein